MIICSLNISSLYLIEQNGQYYIYDMIYVILAKLPFLTFIKSHSTHVTVLMEIERNHEKLLLGINAYGPQRSMVSQSSGRTWCAEPMCSHTCFFDKAPAAGNFRGSF